MNAFFKLILSWLKGWFLLFFGGEVEIPIPGGGISSWINEQAIRLSEEGENGGTKK